MHKFISIEDVERITHLKRGTLYNMHSRREGPPVHKVGHRLLYREDLLSAWIESKATVKESEAQ